MSERRLFAWYAGYWRVEVVDEGHFTPEEASILRRAEQYYISGNRFKDKYGTRRHNFLVRRGGESGNIVGRFSNRKAAEAWIAQDTTRKLDQIEARRQILKKNRPTPL